MRERAEAAHRGEIVAFGHASLGKPQASPAPTLQQRVGSRPRGHQEARLARRVVSGERQVQLVEQIVGRRGQAARRFRRRLGVDAEAPEEVAPGGELRAMPQPRQRGPGTPRLLSA